MFVHEQLTKSSLEVVREHVLQKKNEEVLRIVPEAIVLGNATLSGDAWHRQLLLGHSAYIAFANGWRLFTGLSRVLPDRKAAEYYWMLFAADENVADAKHWLKTATKKETYDYCLNKVQELAPEFREIVQVSREEGIKGMVVGTCALSSSNCHTKLRTRPFGKPNYPFYHQFDEYS